MTTQTKTQTIDTATAQHHGEHTQLTRRYGSIGIEAVAAAAQFADRRKSQVTTSRIDQRFVESAG